MEKIKIAQIGINRYSHAVPIFRTLKNLDSQFEFVGYAPVEDEAEKFSDMRPLFEGRPQLSLAEILDNPEIQAVAVETEEIHLTKYALMAARRGKHIHMEKPGGRKYGDFQALIETARQSGLVLHLGYMYRYNPMVRQLLGRIKRGELGEIISVEAQMNCIHPPEVRQWLGTFPGGMLFFLGCHLIDLVLQIQGKPEEILPLNRCTGLDGVTAEDFGMAVFRYPRGVSFVKTCAAERGGFGRRQLVVTSSKETVELKPLEVMTTPGTDILYTHQTQWNDTDWHKPGVTARSQPQDRYESMMAAFAGMVRGEVQNPYTYDYELELYRTLLQCCGAELS